MRLFLILGLLGILSMLVFFLDSALETSAWAIHDGENWQIIATGWGLLLHGWLIALAGLAVGGGLVLAIMGYLYGIAENTDHEQAINDQKHLVSEAVQRADEAESQAEAQYRKQLQFAEDREKRAFEQHREAEKMQEQASKMVRQANEQARLEQENALQAKQKSQNAQAAFHRKKRKLERLAKNVAV